jgi:hypothetical protein
MAAAFLLSFDGVFATASIEERKSLVTQWLERIEV